MLRRELYKFHAFNFIGDDQIDIFGTRASEIYEFHLSLPGFNVSQANSIIFSLTRGAQDTNPLG